MTQNIEAPPVEDVVISIPHISPWARYPVCPKCGVSLGEGISILNRLMCAFGKSAQEFIWCKGNLDSTITAQNGPFTLQAATPCFGIYSEHLHLRCGMCHFSWLMACKPVEKPSVLRDIRTFVKWTLIASGVGTLLFLLLSMNGGQ